MPPLPAPRLLGPLPPPPLFPPPADPELEEAGQPGPSEAVAEAEGEPVRVRWLQIAAGTELQATWTAGVDHCYTVWSAPGSLEDLRGVHCGGFRAWQALESRFPDRWYEGRVCVRRFNSLERAVASYFDPDAIPRRVRFEFELRCCWVYFWQ